MRKQVILAGAGISLIAASVISQWSPGSTRNNPGGLVARSPQVDWQSPPVGVNAISQKARFEIVNVGNKAVRITEVSSACGCAKPRVEPRLVPPSGIAIVEVEAEPLEIGDKSVAIGLLTDSPTTPEISLVLNIHGRRPAPFVALATGDLYYRSGYEIGESRNITVDVIEDIDAEHEAPKVTLNSPFFRVGDPTEKPVEHIYAPNAQLKAYTWKIPLILIARPPEEGFSGVATVHDRWIEGRTLEIAIKGDADPAIKVLPSRLVLRVSPDSGSVAVASTQFMVRAKRNDQRIKVVNAPTNPMPLIIEPVGQPDQYGLARYSVSVKPGQVMPEGKYAIVAFVDGNESEKAIALVQFARP